MLVKTVHDFGRRFYELRIRIYCLKKNLLIYVSLLMTITVLILCCAEYMKQNWRCFLTVCPYRQWRCSVGQVTSRRSCIQYVKLSVRTAAIWCGKQWLRGFTRWAVSSEMILTQISWTVFLDNKGSHRDIFDYIGWLYRKVIFVNTNN